MTLDMAAGLLLVAALVGGAFFVIWRAVRMDRLDEQSAKASRSGDTIRSQALARDRMAMTRSGRAWLRRLGL